MKHWKIILLFIVLAALASACNKEAPEPNDPENQEEEVSIVLSEAVREMSIWQHEGDSSQQILIFQEEMPSEPVKLAVHAPLASVHLTLKDGIEATPNQLDKLLELTGAEAEIRTVDHNPGQFQIVLHNMTAQAKLTLGDLQDIHLKKADQYLQFILNQSSLKLPYALLIHAPAEGSSHIYVSDQEESVVIRFTETMQQLVKPGTEWLSETQLRIHLQETGGVLALQDYFSDEGNYVDRRLESIVIHSIPSRTWLDAASGGDVGWSGRDGYYDYLLFAPGRTAYAGVMALHDDLQQGEAHYGLVLESQGQAPIVLDQTIYLDRETNQLPVYWLDSQTLLFQSQDGAWRVDLETGRWEQVLRPDQDERLVTFQYDQATDRIYWLTESLSENNGEQYWTGHLKIYNRDLALLERHEGISDPWPAISGKPIPFDIAVHAGDLYVTTFKDGRVVTYYKDLFGDVEEGIASFQPGKLIGVAEDGVFLISDEGEGLTWWSLDGGASPIMEIEATTYMMFGGDLFALQEGRTNTYFIYSLSQNEWLEWSPNDGRDSWIPNQQTAYYRITN